MNPHLTLKTLHFPNSCYACFMPVAQQTHIPANRIHFSVLVIKAMCVYCEVGTALLCVCYLKTREKRMWEEEVKMLQFCSENEGQFSTLKILKQCPLILTLKAVWREGKAS